jgi:ketosteroid isomerase-like protein
MAKEEPGNAIDSFRRYAQAFQSLDPKAVAQHFYEPSLLITPQGILALSTAADVERAYARLMADLPARGYAGTAFSVLTERRLSDDLALVTGAGVWKKASGEEFMPFGLTYTLRRSGSTWRIVVGVIHDPDSKA